MLRASIGSSFETCDHRPPDLLRGQDRLGHVQAQPFDKLRTGGQPRRKPCPEYNEGWMSAELERGSGLRHGRPSRQVSKRPFDGIRQTDTPFHDSRYKSNPSSQTQYPQRHRRHHRTGLRGPAIGRGPAQRPRAACASHSAALSAGVGIDVDPSKVDAINQGRSYISDIPSDRLRKLTIDHWQLTIDHSPL